MANTVAIARNTVFLTLRMVFVLVVSLATTRVLLAALGVDDYGIYNAVCGFVSMFGFLNVSMSNGIQRFYNYEIGIDGDVGKVFSSAVLLQLLLAFSVVLLAETLGLWYVKNVMVIPGERLPAAISIFHLSVAAFVFGILQVPFLSAVFAYEKMDFYAIVSIVDIVLKLAIVFLLRVASSDKMVLYGALFTGVSFFTFIMYFVFAVRKFGQLRFRMPRDKDLLKSVASFSGWNMFGTFAGMMREQGLNLILNLFFGPVVNAARAVAYQVSAGLQNLVGVTNVAVRPQLVQSYAKGDEKMSVRMMMALSKFNLYVIYLIGFPLILELGFILKLWLGNNIPENTEPFIVIVVFIAAVSSLNAAVSVVVHAVGKMRKYQLVTSIIVLLSLAVCYLVLKLGGNAVSAMLVSLAFVMAMQVASLFVLRSLVPFSIKEYMSKVIFPALLVMLLSSLLPLLAHFLMPYGWLRLMTVFVAAVLSASLLIYYIGLEAQEKRLVQKFIHPNKRNDTTDR